MTGQAGVARSLVRVVERRVDERIVQYLETLLEDARNGKVVGLLATVHYGKDDFAYTGAGSFCDQPSIGAVALTRLAERLAD